MRSLLETLSAVLLGFGVLACGSTTRQGQPVAHTSSATGTDGARGQSPSGRAPGPGESAVDGDNDNDNPVHSRYDGDDNAILSFGHTPSVAEERLIVTLIKRYYAAVAANDGTRGCSL